MNCYRLKLYLYFACHCQGLLQVLELLYSMRFIDDDVAYKYSTVLLLYDAVVLLGVLIHILSHLYFLPVD
jgi:hypothetical protein